MNTLTDTLWNNFNKRHQWLLRIGLLAKQLNEQARKEGDKQ